MHDNLSLCISYHYGSHAKDILKMRSRTEEEEDIDSSTIDILDTLDDEGNDVLEFGWENEPKKTGGRQKKVQKKAKVGTFGRFCGCIIFY